MRKLLPDTAYTQADRGIEAETLEDRRSKLIYQLEKAKLNPDHIPHDLEQLENMITFCERYLFPAIEKISGADWNFKQKFLNYAKNPIKFEKPYDLKTDEQLLEFDHVSEDVKQNIRDALNALYSSDWVVNKFKEVDQSIKWDLIPAEFIEFLKFAFRFAALRELKDNKLGRKIESFYKES